MDARWKGDPFLTSALEFCGCVDCSDNFSVWCFARSGNGFIGEIDTGNILKLIDTKGLVKILI